MFSLWFEFLGIDQKFLNSNENAFINRIMISEIMFETEKIFINENDQYSSGNSFLMNETLAELSYMIEKSKTNLF